MADLPEFYKLGNSSLFHALILFIILSVLFFMYIANVAGDAINGSLVNLVDDALSAEKLNNMIPNKNFIKNIFSNLKIDTATVDNYIQQILNTENTFKKTINDNILNMTIVITAFLLVSTILVNIIPAKLGNYNIHLKTNLMELVAVFSLIGVVEFLFFTNVASKYVPSLPSEILTLMKEKLISKFQN
jgi:hypothetical protein